MNLMNMVITAVQWVWNWGILVKLFRVYMIYMLSIILNNELILANNQKKLAYMLNGGRSMEMPDSPFSKEEDERPNP